MKSCRESCTLSQWRRKVLTVRCKTTSPLENKRHKATSPLEQKRCKTTYPWNTGDEKLLPPLEHKRRKTTSPVEHKRQNANVKVCILSLLCYKGKVVLRFLCSKGKQFYVTCVPMGKQFTSLVFQWGSSFTSLVLHGRSSFLHPLCSKGKQLYSCGLTPRHHHVASWASLSLYRCTHLHLLHFQTSHFVCQFEVKTGSMASLNGILNSGNFRVRMLL